MYQWLTKIFFQMLYLERRLAADVKNPDRGTIVTDEFLEQYRLEHLLLNSVRVPVRLSRPPLWSIFVLPAQTSGVPERNFDFLDNLHGQVVAIRMGEIAVIASLMDGQAQQQLMGAWFSNVARGLRLHPVQFRELAARVVYQRRTMTRIPRFMTTWSQQQNSFQVVTLPFGGLSTRPIFDTWRPEAYAFILHFFVGDLVRMSYDDLFVPPNLVMTFLKDARNRYMRIPFEADVIDAGMQRNS